MRSRVPEEKALPEVESILDLEMKAEQKSMGYVNAIRWIAIALHGIVLAFALFVIITITNWDSPASSMNNGDSATKQMIWLVGFTIVGNGLGIVLLLTRLFKSSNGSCLLVIYEVAFFIASLVWLSIDYSIIIAVITFALLYIAVVRRKQA